MENCLGLKTDANVHKLGMIWAPAYRYIRMWTRKYR